MQAYYASTVKNWAARLGVYFPKERPEDIELLAAVSRGEQKSMEQLYLRYGPALHCVAKVMMGSETEAEDLLHDVFCEACEKAKSYEAARGSVGTWLLVRLRSRAIDRIKSPRFRRLVPLDNIDLDAEQAATEVSPAAKYLALVTRRNLAKLPSAQRRLLQLLFYGDRSAAEAADELKIPLGTVKSRLARTLGRLRGDSPHIQSTQRASATAMTPAQPVLRRRHRSSEQRTALTGSTPFLELLAADRLSSY